MRDKITTIVPFLTWEKRVCPMCGQNTGPNSKCGNSMVDADEADDASMDMGISFNNALPITNMPEFNSGAMPLFGDQCAFKLYNSYIIETNTPLTIQMGQGITEINGVEQLQILSKYKAILTIGRNFDEQDVKQQVTEYYTEKANKKCSNTPIS
jgi:hypothetical protein